MEHRSSSEPSVDVNLDNAHEQEQSPFFTMLPLDIRRLIYLQLWLDYGTTQHIFCFGGHDHLLHYPCLLEKDAFNHHRPPSPTPSEDANQADSGGPTALEAGAANDENILETESVGEDNEPGLYDDPGDIDGAIQDITASQHQADSDSDLNMHYWRDSPWCMHEKCFRTSMEAYDMSVRLASERNYRRRFRVATSVMGIAKPLVICKAMYIEASESLYSTMSFSFPAVPVLEQFVTEVPWSLRKRIQVVDVMATAMAVYTGFPRQTRSLPPQDPSPPPLVTLCTKLKCLIPNVQELRLCLHLLNVRQDAYPMQLPDKKWFEPLYHLFSEMNQQQLRKFDVKLVTRCDRTRSENEDVMTYGSTPKSLRDAPFSVVLVPKGYHSCLDCGVYWVKQDGA